MNKLKRIIKSMYCMIFGHKWQSIFNAKGRIDKPIEGRTFCTRCGVYYHKHKYHNEQE